MRTTHDTAVVSVTGLTKRFGSVVALAGLDLMVGPAEVVGLVGPNGAGKTTLINCLAGLISPDAGSLRLRGIGGSAPTVSFVYEVDALPVDMTVEACLRCESSALGVPASAVSAALAEVGLAAVRRRYIRGLSLGNRRRVAVALALMADSDLLVMDEPTNGLDIEGLRIIRGVVNRQRKHGKSVLFSSHTMSEVERVADRIVVVSHGRVRFSGTITSLRQETGAATLDEAYETVLQREDDQC